MRLDAATKERVEQHYWCVFRALKKSHITPRHGLYHELVSGGTWRLIDCCRRYNPAYADRFATYCVNCICKEFITIIRTEVRHGMGGTRSQRPFTMSYLSDCRLDQRQRPVPLGATLAAPEVQTEPPLRLTAETTAAIDQLPEKLRFLVRAFYLHHWRIDEIARSLGVCHTTAHHWKDDALASLRRTLTTRES